ncbi:MAG: hypothetical protein IJ898_06600 [Prevotella sp.]|nr:hypothetical protein [Prevotella sp.]
MSSNNNDKETKFSPIYGLAIIGVLFFAIILSASIMGVFKGYEPYQQLIAAMLSVAATGVITALLLYFQRRQQEQLNQEQRVFEEKQKDKDKERLLDTKIFEERLRIYKEFLRKLCDVVKDQNITLDEEIEMQFQVSYIAMHTKSESIKTISDNVKKIILSIKKGENEANNMLAQLFEIADVFHNELYEDDSSAMSEETIMNFKSILIGKEDIQEYENDEKKLIIQTLEEKIKTGKKLKDAELFKLFKAKIDPSGSDSCALFYRGKLLNYEYYTKINENNKYVNSKDTIAIDFLIEDNEYIIRVGTRRNDPEITRKIAIAIDGEFRPGNTDVTASHWHVHARKVLSTNNDEMVHIMNELLAKIKAYRDKEYPLK